MPSSVVFIHPNDTHLDSFLENVQFKVLRVPSIGWSSQSHGKLAGQPSSAPTKSRPARPVVYILEPHVEDSNILKQGQSA
ncbi:hypothetical protein PGT21_013914 [Puccinia graminis f. sp. tritici]|uniref:Uncharacterized protein n=1 Tax=Puccinia graminis f. sp. tritici TaxID=56615 RepID=A0A5B0P5W1_PUCGR|nr:hypothetical protein PGT21_013914 [Puccinia graminis f. sp. tritici]